jgi:3-isopropylmalate/(R)-2-methylmalate dehydratase large subunit
MADRFTMANMAIEAGGKAGLFDVDDNTLEYLAGRATRQGRIYRADEGARYLRTIEVDVGQIPPLVAYPHLPENVHPAAEAADVRIDQSVIGSCTNGRIEDLRIAAGILRGRGVHPDVRCIVIPGTQRVYLEALREGLIEAFVEAGAAVSTPTCGPCLGGHMGVLAAGERAVSTTNRNFRGRMGHPESEVYLAGPAVAASSAIAGHISTPQAVLS